MTTATQPIPAPTLQPSTTPGGAVARVADLVDLLLCVAHIDGDFHRQEEIFVQRYLESVLLLAEELGGGSPEQRTWVHSAYQAHFMSLRQELDAEVRSIAGDLQLDAAGCLAAPRLRQRAVARFRGLAPADQASALELVRAMMHADGVISEPEQVLYADLLRSFTPPPAGPTLRSLPPTVVSPNLPHGQPIVVGATRYLPLTATAHPLLDPLEQTYSPHPIELQSQIALDYQLMVHATSTWRNLRGPAEGLLTGITDVAQIPAGAQFLDRFVHVFRPRKPVELVVLGDLHGCYACLKAALLQSNFVNRVWAHQWDPHHYPDVKLVLLGDYIDRGRFSFDGVLRAVLQLFVAMPDHVFVLRGNHEHFLSHEGRVFSLVHPAEGLSSITPYVSFEMLEAYRALFEQMPTSLLFDRTLFVHGGIPRDDTIAAHYRDLSSLGDHELRFQMLWSDPAPVDVVPLDSQRHNSRFQFGRQQFRAFMERIGCHTLIRGHEQIEAGFDIIYDLGDRRLLSLFSAGGCDNRDLPVDSAYRRVTPMAFTIQHDAGGLRGFPWPIDYRPFNYDVHNGLHRTHPVLEHRYT